MIVTSVSHYRNLERPGGGGMGVVNSPSGKYVQPLNFWPAASPELAADPRFDALMTRVGVRSVHRASGS